MTQLIGLKERKEHKEFVDRLIWTFDATGNARAKVRPFGFGYPALRYFGAFSKIVRDSMCPTRSLAIHRVGSKVRVLKSFSAWSR